MLESIARDNDCAVLVTDHEPYEEGKAGTKDRPRGSTAKPATVDYVLRCLREDTETTVTPGRGMARFGIDVFAFAVDVRGEPVAVSSDDAPFEGARSAKPGSRLDPDGYLWPDPEIDDPMRAWFVANVAADGTPSTWTQCRKRIRKETQIVARTERLKASYDRVAAWHAGGGPRTATPTPRDRGDGAVPESGDRPGPIDGTAGDPPVPEGGPRRSPPYRGTGPGTGVRGPVPGDRLGTDPEPAEPFPASGDDTDRAAGSDYWRREYDTLIADGIDPAAHDCIATCSRCDRARTRCAITPAGPVCQVCRLGLPRGVRPAEDYPGYAPAAAQLIVETATEEQRVSAASAMRRVLAVEYDKAAKARGMIDYRNPYAPDNKAAPLAGPARKPRTAPLPPD